MLYRLASNPEGRIRTESAKSYTEVILKSKIYVFSNTFSTLLTIWNTLFMPCTPVYRIVNGTAHSLDQMVEGLKFLELVM
jgi:hypothetical protein